MLWVLFGLFLAFLAWASLFRIDQVARARGELIATSRIQVIQTVDGGVLETLKVREGDRVKPGDVLATLDQTRIGAAVREVEARRAALEAKATRLRAEVLGDTEPVFSESVLAFPDLAAVEGALFTQRRAGLEADMANLARALALAEEERDLVEALLRSGDSNNTEYLRVQRAVIDAEARFVNRRNKYLEDVGLELTKVEDELAQTAALLTQRKEQLFAAVFRARLPGIVKNIRITTVGGVLRAGEELMQIVPTEDPLLLEAKVRPEDISMVRLGQSATLRLDPFDYTIYGSVAGEVVYISADTLKEDSPGGEEVYYRVQLSLGDEGPVQTSAGYALELLPGMTAQVDIRSGDRTVLAYLLKPLRKTLAESFGER